MQIIYKLKLLILIILLSINFLGSNIMAYAVELDTVKEVETNDGSLRIESSRMAAKVDKNGYPIGAYRDKDGTYKSIFYYGDEPMDIWSGTESIRFLLKREGEDNKIFGEIGSINYFKVEDHTIKMVKTEENIGKYTLEVSIVNATKEGAYMKIQMEMENLKDTPQEMGTNVLLDTMVNDNDESPFIGQENGWINHYNGFQISGFFKDTIHTTNADGIAVGNWYILRNEFLAGNDDSRKSWAEHKELVDQDIETGDGASTIFYDPIVINPGESRKISFIVGAGPQNEAPILKESNISQIGEKHYKAGENIIVTGTVFDKDEVANDVYVMLLVGDNEEVKLGELDLSGGEKSFSYTYTLPNELKERNNDIKLWVIDSAGMTSKLDQGNIILLDEIAPDIKLNGESHVEVTIGETYTDAGATAYDNIDGDLTNEIELNNTVDTSKSGEYKVTYTVADKAGNVAKAERVVVVIEEVDENIKPTIITNPNKEYSNEDYRVTLLTNSKLGQASYSVYRAVYYKTSDMEEFTVYEEPFKISKEGTTKITGRLVTRTTKGTVVDYVYDDEEKTVTLDKTAPNIKINGESHVMVNRGKAYTDAGATAYDNIDGDITSKIRVDNSVNMSKVGEYKVTYTVEDKAGNVAKVERVVVVRKKNEDSSDDDKNSGISSQQKEIKVIVNGKVYRAGTEKIIEKNGKKEVELLVNRETIHEKIKEALNKKKYDKNLKNIVQVPVETKNVSKVKTVLTGDIIKKMEDYSFDLSVKAEDTEYIIPAKEFTIENVANQLGVDIKELKKIEVQINMNKVEEEKAKEIKEVAKKNNYEIISNPVEFNIVTKTETANGKEKELEVSKFSQYVERILEIPEGIDPNKITTGIVVNEDNTFAHIPTEVFIKDGKYYAKLKSLTNSTYSIIYNPIEVASVKDHWSKEYVNDMASRLVVKNKEIFMPDKAITRGEFAEYITKALGLYRTDVAKERRYKDISIDHPLADAIEIATEYKIINGYPDGTFRADGKITREEAMTMYKAAMDIVELKEKDTNKIETYKDKDKISPWAYDFVKKTLSANVFNGRSKDIIAPKGTFTHAEAATAIRNLLVESNLINK